MEDPKVPRHDYQGMDEEGPEDVELYRVELPNELVLRRGAAPRPRTTNPLAWVILAALGAGIVYLVIQALS